MYFLSEPTEPAFPTLSAQAIAVWQRLATADLRIWGPLKMCLRWQMWVFALVYLLTIQTTTPFAHAADLIDQIRLTITKSCPGCDLRGMDLSRVNLANADLSGTNLGGAVLSNADLSTAKLYRANLSGANLRHAKLIKADLRGATMQNVDLSRADLSEANLDDANLNGAVLREANLDGANVTNTSFLEVDFTDVRLGSIDLSSVDPTTVTGLKSLRPGDYQEGSQAYRDQPDESNCAFR